MFTSGTQLDKRCSCSQRLSRNDRVESLAMVLDVLELWEFSVFLYRGSSTGVQLSPGCIKPSFMSSRFVAFYWVSRGK